MARQILQKSGVRLWWVSLPRELPLPAVFVGMDVFHAPKEFHAESGRRVAKPSCAAIVVQVVRPDSEQRHFVEFYSETIARLAGQEFGLESALERVVKTALVLLKVRSLTVIFSFFLLLLCEFHKLTLFLCVSGGPQILYRVA